MAKRMELPRKVRLKHLELTVHCILCLAHCGVIIELDIVLYLQENSLSGRRGGGTGGALGARAPPPPTFLPRV